uniref:Transmembrane protein 80 n=1 Tax=Neogobius melanostomus TaxID=47308 RepID=A0A8C6SLH0_9GOBI
MATYGGGGRSTTSELSSACFQLVLRLTVGYFVFYFLFTLGLIIRKTWELSYPTDALSLDVALLFLLALLEVLLFFCGVKGSLTESEPYCVVHLLLTGGSVVLTVYFLWWQTYVVWADLILSSVLLVLYGLSGLLACSALARLAKYSTTSDDTSKGSLILTALTKTRKEIE